MEGSIFTRFWKRWVRSSGPTRLNLEVPRVAPAKPAPSRPATPSREPDVIPGNFQFFDMFLQFPIGGTVYIGSPKVAMRDMISKEVRWGSKVEHLAPGPDSLQIPWVDDPQRGIGVRQISKPEDILGAEGMVAQHRLRFERILDMGANVVVYALLNPEHQFRMAYGFHREAVEPGYANVAVRTKAAWTAEQQAKEAD